MTGLTPSALQDGVDRVAVVACYNIILGRAPESEAAIVPRIGLPLATLAEILISSEEFSALLTGAQESGSLPHVRQLDRNDFAVTALWLSARECIPLPADVERWWLLLDTLLRMPLVLSIVDRLGFQEFAALVKERAQKEASQFESLRAFVKFDPVWFARTYPEYALVRFADSRGDDLRDVVHAIVRERRQLLSAFSQGLESFYIGLKNRRFDRIEQLAGDMFTAAQRGDLTHWLFDQQFFLDLLRSRTAHDEIALQFLKGARTSYLDFLGDGDTAGFAPHPLFSHYTYSSRNVPVAEEQNGSLFQHFISRGCLSGYDTSVVFDQKYYIASYPSAANEIANGNFTCPLHHFLCVGIFRDYRFCPDFDIAFYRDSNRGIFEDVGKGIYPTLTWHFVFHGLNGGLAPNPYFDPAYYRERHPTVVDEMRKLGIGSELEHFLQLGKIRGYKPARQPADCVPCLDVGKAISLRRARRSYNHLLRRGLDFTSFRSPGDVKISVIVPVCGEPEFTSRFLTCTYFAASHLERVGGHGCEIIIVENGSRDGISRVFERCEGLTVLTYEEPIGFPRAVNAGVAASHGEVVIVCNNDIEFEPDVFDRIVTTLLSDDTIGVVGGQTILPNESLQEVGSFMDYQGSVIGLGRGEDPWDAAYQARRTVDYCTGSFTAFRRADFDALGGFDEAFSPGYYEDADFSFRLRDILGKSSVVDPAIQITHFEHASFGKGRPPTSSYAMIAKNRHLFVSKHRTSLETRPSNRVLMTTEGRARPAVIEARRFLFIEDLIPDTRLGSGFGRMQRILESLTQRDVGVDLLVLNPNALLDDYADPRVKIYKAWMRGEDVATVIGRFAERYSHIVVCRTHNLARFADLLEDVRVRHGIRIICDTEALSSLRAAEIRMLAGTAYSPDAESAALHAELSTPVRIARWIAVSAYEKQKMESVGVEPVSVLGYHVEVSRMTPDTPWEQRKRILLVGPVHAAGTPNYDGILWFLGTIYPLCKDALQGLTLTLAGAWQPDVFESFKERFRSIHIEFAGSVSDAALVRLYGEARVALAPTRFAAGVPIKVLESFSFGVPIVMTDLLERQLFGGSAPHSSRLAVGLRGDGGVTFAAWVSKLATDRELWADLKQRQQEAAKTLAGVDEFEAAIHEVFIADEVRALR